MPERYFDVRWPDGVEQRCYSPSSVVDQFFTPEHSYDLSEFVRRSEQALTLASERVRDKYGYFCSAAADQLSQIKFRSEQFEKQDTVTVLRIY
ncbi:MSMEG_0570 family nitrogen starvation response protein [Ketobacter sp. MCCC 1A13808]|uniref:MSMEG_0570 family nitrogen starvation response protein n=1 Tax=Ketobacter sp. MCCC 1A13808 TaxID=2602738 RepID=UPI000F2BD762|nr:MSMEG_0570 family nitrogen starvation response protein [Ketobacter sp. MCCC 1A13808]MVF11521.1 MSMEG_0570 family nitrogen starvation response protein [Ketobacter sp. MCCC 1A13808]RLP53275.1 MAG: MSMEG_0570 family nitrogen starvation response protein [Ketobacter sp.]